MTANWQEATFQQLFESAPDAAIVVDGDGQIVLANAHAEELFGYSREELLGQSIELLVPERFRAAHVDQRRGYVAEPRKRPMGHPGLDLRGLRKDGREFPAEIALGPLETDRGLLVTAIVRDTSRHRGAAAEQVVRHRVEEYAALLRNSLTHVDVRDLQRHESVEKDQS
jgi:PAS domain S-box-containing protein